MSPGTRCPCVDAGGEGIRARRALPPGTRAGA